MLLSLYHHMGMCANQASFLFRMFMNSSPVMVSFSYRYFGQLVELRAVFGENLRRLLVLAP